MKTPLVVDLDGTLLRNDSLIEMFVFGLLRQPWIFLKALLSLFDGRSAFKQRIFQINQLDVNLFPIRDDFLDFLHKEKRTGRDIFLVTAADQQLADVIARKLGIFESASGSKDGHNLKGKQKLEYLQKRFPHGFAYAGNSSTDIPIWKEAASIILVGTSEPTRRAAQSLKSEIEHDFSSERIGFGLADEGERLARAQLEVHAVDGTHRAHCPSQQPPAHREVLGQTLGDEQSRAHASSPAASTQRTQCPRGRGRSEDGSEESVPRRNRSGTSSEQLARRSLQRGWKGQPLGRVVASGT